MTVEDNVVSGHRDGLYFEFVQDTTIERNTSERNGRYGLHFMFSHRCAYRDNRFAWNGAGVAVMHARSRNDREHLRRQSRSDRMRRSSRTSATAALPAISSRGTRSRCILKGAVVSSCRRIALAGNGWAIRLHGQQPGNRFDANVFEGIPSICPPTQEHRRRGRR